MPTAFTIPWGNWAERKCWGPIANVPSNGVLYRYYFNGFWWEIRVFLPHDHYIGIGIGIGSAEPPAS